MPRSASWKIAVLNAGPALFRMRIHRAMPVWNLSLFLPQGCLASVMIGCFGKQLLHAESLSTCSYSLDQCGFAHAGMTLFCAQDICRAVVFDTFFKPLSLHSPCNWCFKHIVGHICLQMVCATVADQNAPRTFQKTKASEMAGVEQLLENYVIGWSGNG